MARHQDFAFGPIHVLPPQSQHFRRASEAPVAAQSEDQPPFGIRAGFDDFFGFLAADEVLSLRVSDRAGLQVFKRVRRNEALLDGGLDDLLRHAGPLACGCFGKSDARQIPPPFVGVVRRDLEGVLEVLLDTLHEPIGSP
ncbi:MAG TPA: hypothetical protein PKZ07_17095 [Sedimentisphaerales bacterium]|nr:hypothetical protein [Sedimentisphaerales bacterium]